METRTTIPERQAPDAGPPETQGKEDEGRGQTPIQYYSRSELPQREIGLNRFSPNRKSTWIALSLVAALLLIVAGAALSTMTMQDLRNGAGTSNPERYAELTRETARSAQVKTLGFSAGAVAALMVMVYIIARAGPRIVALELWIRRMGAGDLNYTMPPRGNDEITELAYDLEVLRRQSVRAQQLDLVQQLSEDLQDKNDQLEEVLQELRNTQDQVVSRQKLAELGELTAGVAHEIRNPLNLIQNFARTSESMMDEMKEVMEEIGYGAPTDEQKEIIEELTGELTGNMERMRQHGDRANRIVQDMLAMGRSTKGNYHTVLLNELVEDHAMLAYHSARSRDAEFNLKIVREYDEEAGEISVVSEDIGRVIMNLVGNACYATRERAKEEPSHEPAMWLTTRRSGGDVEITVRDNGPGIPEDVIGKIFNPFFTTKPTDQGTGLGLSLSNDIVREHGGSITPESEPGSHTRFTVKLPAQRQPGAMAAGPEDEEDNRE